MTKKKTIKQQAAEFELQAIEAAATGDTIYEDAIPDWDGCPRAWKPYSAKDRAFDRLVAQHIAHCFREEDQRIARREEARRKALVGEDAVWRPRCTGDGWAATIHEVVVHLQRGAKGRYLLRLLDDRHQLDAEHAVEAKNAAQARDIAARRAARHLVGRVC